MQHRISMAYVRIDTQQCTFLHELSSDHHNDNFEAFLRLSMLLIADKTNTNSCQAWILVIFTNMAPAHSSTHYRQMFWYHLIEETYSYPHVLNFSENVLKYLYEGTFENCKLFLRRTVYYVFIYSLCRSLSSNSIVVVETGAFSDVVASSYL